MDRMKKQNSQALWLEDAKFSHSGPQRTAVEPKDLGRPVFSADFPLSLLEDSHNMFALNRFERFLRSRYILLLSLQFIHQAQLGSRGVDHRTFEDVFQLPDIAGPVIILQGIPDSRRNDLNGLAHSLGDLFDVKIHKKWNVIQPITERRHGNRENI